MLVIDILTRIKIYLLETKYLDKVNKSYLDLNTNFLNYLMKNNR